MKADRAKETGTPANPRDKARVWVWALAGGYGLAVALFLAARGQTPPWELGLMALLAAEGLRSRSQTVWIQVILPFTLLLLAYRGLSGFARGLAPEDINIVNLIEWEKGLFRGVMPPAWLQRKLFEQVWTPALDAVCNLLYLSHFVAPPLAAVWVRSRRRERFWPYMLGFFCLAYAGFATYLLAPAAPPWWATRFGYLSGAEAVSLSHFVIPPETMFKTPNPLAALPSMHCAYPLFIALSAASLAGRRALWWLSLPLGVGFAVVYLGHHYVVDVLVGYAYGLAAWALTFGLKPPRRPLGPGGSV